MKNNKLISLLILLNLILSVLLVNSQFSGIYNPQYLSKEYKEEKKTYPVILSAKEYGIAFTHGFLCGVPVTASNVFKLLKGTFKKSFVMAGFLDAGFSIALQMFGITNEPNHVTKEMLEQRLVTLFENMKVYVENRVDAEKMDYSRIQYLKLRSPIQNFRDLQGIMGYELNVTGTVSLETKNSIVSTYWVLLAALEEATIEFGDDSRIYQTSLLFLETSILYGIALKDGIQYGMEMGLPKYILDEITDGNTNLQKKYDTLCNSVIETWSKMIDTLVGARNEQIRFDKKQKKKDETTVDRTKFKIPSKGELISSFHFANPIIYPSPVFFINENNLTSGEHVSKDTGKIKKFNNLNLDAPIGSMYVIDAFIMKIGTRLRENVLYTGVHSGFFPIYDAFDYDYPIEKTSPFEENEQKNDFLTGFNGYLNINGNSINSFSIKLNISDLQIKKNLVFRFIYSYLEVVKLFGQETRYVYIPFDLRFYSKSGDLLEFNKGGDSQEFQTQLTKQYHHVNARYMQTRGPFDFSSYDDEVVIEISPYNIYAGSFVFISFQILT